MTQEEKQLLLLKDLCARLPYRVIVHIHDIDVDDYDRQLIGEDLDFIELDRRNCKPYLFPLSSMTIEQRCELHDLIHNLNVLAINREVGDWVVSSSEIDWYNKNHFDYRGLIEKGLAIDATDKNIY